MQIFSVNIVLVIKNIYYVFKFSEVFESLNKYFINFKN